jgi:hypothetical protein
MEVGQRAARMTKKTRRRRKTAGGHAFSPCIVPCV